jgi:hypothetical protein
MVRHKKLSSNKAVNNVGEIKKASMPKAGGSSKAPKYLSKREVKLLLESDDDLEEVESEVLVQPSTSVAANSTESFTKSNVAPKWKKVSSAVNCLTSTAAYKSDVSSDISDNSDDEVSLNLDNENILNVSYKSEVTRHVVKKNITKSSKDSKSKPKYQYSSEELAFFERQKEYFRKIDQHELNISE